MFDYNFAEDDCQNDLELFCQKLRSALGIPDDLTACAGGCNSGGCGGGGGSGNYGMGTFGCGGDCDDCTCDDGKKCSGKKPNSETVQDDGCFCRKCNEFLPFVEPDDKRDGKTLCYKCANPWW